MNPHCDAILNIAFLIQVEMTKLLSHSTISLSVPFLSLSWVESTGN